MIGYRTAYGGSRLVSPHRAITRVGSEGWYAWSYLIPDTYPEDEDPTTRWQIVTQFHDQPNLAAGACVGLGVWGLGGWCVS